MSSLNVTSFNHFFWYSFLQEGGYNIDCALNGRPETRKEATNHLLTDLQMAGFLIGHIYVDGPEENPDHQTYYLAVPRKGGQIPDPTSDFQRTLDPSQRRFAHLMQTTPSSVGDEILGRLKPVLSFHPAKNNACLEVYDPFSLQPYGSLLSEP